MHVSWTEHREAVKVDLAPFTPPAGSWPFNAGGGAKAPRRLLGAGQNWCQIRLMGSRL